MVGAESHLAGPSLSARPVGTPLLEDAVPRDRNACEEQQNKFGGGDGIRKKRVKRVNLESEEVLKR
jgi:hypothetical protein